MQQPNSTQLLPHLPELRADSETMSSRSNPRCMTRSATRRGTYAPPNTEEAKDTGLTAPGAVANKSKAVGSSNHNKEAAAEIATTTATPPSTCRRSNKKARTKGTVNKKNNKACLQSPRFVSFKTDNEDSRQELVLSSTKKNTLPDSHHAAEAGANSRVITFADDDDKQRRKNAVEQAVQWQLTLGDKSAATTLTICSSKHNNPGKISLPGIVAFLQALIDSESDEGNNTASKLLFDEPEKVLSTPVGMPAADKNKQKLHGGAAPSSAKEKLVEFKSCPMTPAILHSAARCTAEKEAVMTFQVNIIYSSATTNKAGFASPPSKAQFVSNQQGACGLLSKHNNALPSHSSESDGDENGVGFENEQFDSQVDYDIQESQECWNGYDDVTTIPTRRSRQEPATKLMPWTGASSILTLKTRTPATANNNGEQITIIG